MPAVSLRAEIIVVLSGVGCQKGDPGVCIHACTNARYDTHRPKLLLHLLDTDTNTIHPSMIHLLASVIFAVSTATAMYTPRSGALACVARARK